ncbi:bifunctional diguanylate cyclase/phosphodiesterase [Ensifer soli]|uniref:bifunctional diguanylate cyclase/phosphodiesterase n=1 Tax=Ciceribacter sp. sgz301302 TaxID=3342379 RepID=UPI0035B9B076
MKRVENLRLTALSLIRFVKPSFVPAAIAACVIVTGGVLFSAQNEQNFQIRLKNSVETELDLVATRLGAEVRGSMSALRGLVNSLSVEPFMERAVFERIATKILVQNSQISRISAAPGGVVSMSFPATSGKAPGTDLTRFSSLRAVTDRARQKAKPVIDGPVRLPSGERGFTVYYPVFTMRSGEPVFWGFVEAAIAERPFYRNAGLGGERKASEAALHGIEGGDGIRLAIRDASLADHVQDAFFGDGALFDQSPVLRSLALPGGTWQLGALPKDGWAQAPDNGDTIRLIILLAVLVVVLPIVLTGNLISERQRNLARLRVRDEELLSLSRRLDMALNASRIGIWEIDLATQKRSWDNRMLDLHGLAPDNPHPTFEAWRASVHPADMRSASLSLLRTLDDGEEYRSQYRVLRADGSVRHIRTVGSVYRCADGGERMTGIAWDVTDDVSLTEELLSAKALADARNAELERTRDQIVHNALHDPLTGLGNRRMLDMKLAELGGDTGLSNVAILHIDLDRFKQINDTLGHAAGDAMLVHAAGILGANVRKGDIVARIGGDEFVLVVTDAPNKTYLAALSERIIGRMRQPVDYNGFPCRFGVSIGIAVARDTPVEASRLLVNADIALYRAKESGRNRHEFFTEFLQAEVIRNKRIADDILEGIEKDQFVVWYQPQFDATTLTLAGVEALIRWQHPRDGLLTPDRFLPIAEELNVTATLDRIVLEKALADDRRWQADGIVIPKISVNVSARRLSDATLLHALDGLQIAPGKIAFELVESIFLDESDDRVTANIAAIKRRGIDIEIDDFGTGHTSIVSLLKIKPKRLKIDRQLVAPILGSKKQQGLIRSIIDIGRSLGVETVAEGVESFAHAEMLGLFGCDLLQGYAFARPLSPEDLARFAGQEALKLAS